MPKVIQVKKLPTEKASPKQTLQNLARFCYLFPQYTFRQARALPFHHVQIMLKEAKKEQAEYYLNMVQIVAAPHSKKGAAVGKLTDQYKGIANGR